MHTRPMIMVTISYIIGILWGIYLQINIFPLCCVTLVLNTYLNNKKTNAKKCNIYNTHYYKIINICVIIVLLANIYTVYKTHRYDNLYKNIEEINCYGTIVGTLKQSDYYDNYIIKVARVNNKESFKNTKILLKVKKQKNNQKIKSENLKYGDYIFFKGNIEIPTTQRNYKGYDYSEYLKTQDIYSICKSEQSSITILKNNSCFIINMWINKLRDIIRNNLFHILPYKNATIASAILIGDSSYIDDTQKEVFSNSSLSHILAISGMHVTYVILGCSVILKKFNKRKGKYILIVFLILFAQLTGSSPSVVRAVIMSSLMIFSKLVYRKSDTLNNIAISCFIILIFNPYNILNLGFQLSFLGTLGIVLFNKKVSILLERCTNKIFSKKFKNYMEKRNETSGQFKVSNEKKNEASRQLETSNERKNEAGRELETSNERKDETSKQLEISNERKDETSREFKTGNVRKIEIDDNKEGNRTETSKIIKTIENLKTILTVSISANILIFPIIIYKFNSLSFIFLISNILVTPILGIMSFCGYATIILSLISLKIAKPISIFFNFIIQIFNKIAELCSNINFARYIIITPNVTTIIFSYILIVYFFFFHVKKHNIIIKKIFSFLICCTLIINLLQKYNSNLIIHFIDVGQGDSTLIITKENKKILIDGGGSESENYDVGESVLLPYLLDRKVKSLDYIIISHFDSDHCKGLFTVIENLNVKNVIISKQGKISENYMYFMELIKNKKINVICVKAGDRIAVDRLTYFDVLWPDDNLINDNVLNNNSIVCKLNYKNISVLFTGDIEAIAEQEIIKKYSPSILQSTILKVAHHGSKSSSIKEFLDVVQPQIALIGVGEKNNFGHPNSGVLERLNAMETKVFRTDINGEISITIDKNGRIIKLEKCISMY